jgi:hypothetical protein
LGSSPVACSFSFTTGAGAAGAATLAFFVLNGSSDSYAGSTSCGVAFGITQVEAGGVATPTAYAYLATASTVAPVYDAVGDPSLLAGLMNGRLEIDIVARILDDTATVTNLPLWTIVLPSGDYIKLVVNATVAAEYVLSWSVSGVTGSVTWNMSQVSTGTRYLYRCHVYPGLRDGAVLTIINLDTDTVLCTGEQGAAGLSAWVFGTLPFSFRLGCDQANSNQWNGYIDEVAT